MEKPWLDQYPEWIPAEIDTSGTDSIVQLCDVACKKFAHARAFGNFGSYLSFAEVDRLADAFAGYLHNELGIKKGDRIALMMPNILQYPIALLGVLRLGGIVVNTNPQYTARELKHQLCDSNAICIIVFEQMLATVSEIADETELKQIVSTNLGDLFPFPKSTLYNRSARRANKNAKPTFTIPVISLSAALKRGEKVNFSRPTLEKSDLAFLQYTGGTTGVSKGAMLSHGNIVANIAQVQVWLSDSIEQGKEIAITALPLYHIYALTVNCLSFFCEGAMNYLITDPRDTRRFIRELQRLPFTGFAGVNTLFQSLIAHEEIKRVDFSNLKYTSGGGAAIQSAVAKDWQALTGTVISQGYGLTETSPVVCVNPFELTEFTGCIGIPVPSTECKIVTDDGKLAGIDEPGELHVRGPQVMRGYWRREDDSAAAFDADGWLRTGDIAVMRADGYFKIVDRKKDMIIVSGFNVYPNEIEDIVAAHPDVAEVAAISVPDAKTVEAVKIVVVRRGSALDPSDLKSFCRESLTAYKVPRHVEFVDELPKSNIGKILRRIVKERHGSVD